MHFRVFAGFAAALILATTTGTAMVPDGASPLTLISAPAVSPDGKSIVFACAEDIWLGPADGGEAIQLDMHPGRDAVPRFSPDGKSVYFYSERSGSMQVYSVSTTGGTVTRHTWHTEGNRLECISPDGREALVRGIRETPGFRATRLIRVDLTADRRQRRLFDATAHSASWSPDGTRVLFCRDGEQSFRKGYHGSRASRIWLYHIEENTFEKMVGSEAEETSPLWHPDGESFYFVSNIGGTSNLWIKSPGSDPKPITSYQGDGILTPDLSSDGGTFVFRRGLDVMRYRPGTDPEPIQLQFWTREKLPDVSSETLRIKGTAGADFTNDLKHVIFSSTGDLWWIPNPGDKPLRLTKTDTEESAPRFSPAGDWLYFLRDDGLAANYHRARFIDGTLKDESPVTRSPGSKTRFKPSPDGSRIAWLEGTGSLFSARSDGSGAKRLYKGWDRPTFDWSPDGRWIAFAAKGSDSSRDILIIRSDGSTPPLNLTRRPTFDGSPRWSPDGRWLVFSSRRGPSGESRLWRIDFGKGGPSLGLTAAAALAVGDQAQMISTLGIEPIRVIWTPDSKALWFQSRTAHSKKLYSVTVHGRDMETVMERRGIPIRFTPDGALLWRVDRTPEILRAHKPVQFPISMSVSRDRDEILRIGFRRIWRTLAERFYQPAMDGTDWPALLGKYESAAIAARSSRQFDRVVTQLIGELNASHLAFLRRPWPNEREKKPREKTTAHPGFDFQDEHSDSVSPLTIRHIIPGSPAALLENPPQAGDIVVRIAGKTVSNTTPLHKFFNGAENSALPVVLRNPEGIERVIELRCISYETARALSKKENLATASKRVTTANPSFTYTAVPSMSKAALDKLKLDIYRANQNHTGLILDLRNNGGGREADRMLSIFQHPTHSFTLPRNGPRSYPIDRLPTPVWNKPFVVLCNQNTFSNAEVFCHAIKESGLAPLVGIATTGGVISTVSTTIPGLGEIKVPFRGWYLKSTGENLDLNGAEPDIRVELTPADENADLDPQLDAALEVLRSSQR